MTRILSKARLPLRVATTLTALPLLMLLTTTPVVNAQTLSLAPPSLAEYNALIADWQKKRDALATATNAATDFATTTAERAAATNAQQKKIDGAKAGLSAAVLKVAEANKRMSRVGDVPADTKGDALAEDLRKSQDALNQIIATSETLQGDIQSMKQEHEKLRSTVDQLKKAVSAAQAAVSAANVFVDAVKSAQQAIAENDSTDGTTQSDLENDFLTDAVNQAETAKKSMEAAQNALSATRKRQTEVGEKLLKAEEQLVNAKQAEESGFKKFAKADELYNKHKAARKIELDKRSALVEEITADLNIAEEQLEAQKQILQTETLAMQDIAAQQATAANKMADLQSDVSQAQSAFDASQATLREEQSKRSVKTAAIIAELNTEMRGSLGTAIPGADTSTPTARVIIPAPVLFAKNSAKIRKSDGIKLADVAATLRDVASRVPEGLDWVVRVDSYSTGGSDESWFLSQNRALSLAQNLIANGKFGPTRVSANGLVNAKALSDATKDGWVEIVLTAR